MRRAALVLATAWVSTDAWSRATTTTTQKPEASRPAELAVDVDGAQTPLNAAPAPSAAPRAPEQYLYTELLANATDLGPAPANATLTANGSNATSVPANLRGTFGGAVQKEEATTPGPAVEMDFHTACKKGLFDVVMTKLQDDKVKKLVNSGNAEGFAPLHLAAAGGHVAVCRLLIEAGARLDLKHMAEQQTALHLAASNPCGKQPVSSVA